jgi:hypothetical protein
MIVCDLLLTDFSQHSVILLLYAGPDQILPLVSILGTVIGFLLIMWRRVVGLVKRTWRLFSKKSGRLPAEVGHSPKLKAAATPEPVTKE